MVKITKDSAFREFLDNKDNLAAIFGFHVPKINLWLESAGQAKLHEYTLYIEWKSNVVYVIEAHSRDGETVPEEKIYEDVPFSMSETKSIFNDYFKEYSSLSSYVQIENLKATPQNNYCYSNSSNAFKYQGYKCDLKVCYNDMTRVPYPSVHFEYRSRHLPSQESAKEIEKLTKEIEALKKKNTELVDTVTQVNNQLERGRVGRNKLRSKLGETKKRMKISLVEMYKSREDKVCGICLDNILPDNLMITNCCHMFCKGCVDGWSKSASQNSDKCPECRMKGFLTE